MIPLPTGLYAYAATALIAAAMAATGAWKVQEWRWNANIAKRDRADAAAREEQARRSARATDNAISSNQATGAYHARLQADLQSQIESLRDARADGRRADALERLRLAECRASAGEAVPRAAARGGADAIPPQWRVDHWLGAPGSRP